MSTEVKKKGCQWEKQENKNILHKYYMAVQVNASATGVGAQEDMMDNDITEACLFGISLFVFFNFQTRICLVKFSLVVKNDTYSVCGYGTKMCIVYFVLRLAIVIRGRIHKTS